MGDCYMWKCDGLGNAYNTRNEDTIYLKVVNVGNVKVVHRHVNDGYEELLTVKSSIQDAIDYVYNYTGYDAGYDADYFTIPISCLKPVG